MFKSPFFVMDLRFCAQQSFCVNYPANFTEEYNKLIDAQDSVEKSNVNSIKTFIPFKASILPFVLFFTKKLFIKFMKAFIELTQAQAQTQSEPLERLFQAQIPETYSEKSHIDCYHLYYQYKDHFKTSGATKISCTPFTTPFFYGIISLK